MSYMTIFSQEKHHFHSVHTFTHIRQHYFSKYWGEQCMGRPPHLKFWGDRPPSPPYVSAPGDRIKISKSEHSTVSCTLITFKRLVVSHRHCNRRQTIKYLLQTRLHTAFGKKRKCGTINLRRRFVIQSFLAVL